MDIERFMDTPELFGCGIGSGTYGDIKCEPCGQKYNRGEDRRGVYDGDSVSWTSFAGKQVCYCCFAAIEEEIWRRREDVIAWLALRIKARKEMIDGEAKRIKDLTSSASEGKVL